MNLDLTLTDLSLMNLHKYIARSSLVIWLVLLYQTVWCQTSNDSEKKLLLNGYIKDLVTFNFVEDNPLSDDKLFLDNLIHNRLNFKWYPNDNLTGFLEIRNRIFHGDLVKAIPNYSSFVDVNNDFFDLSVNVVDRDNLLIHSMIDRLYVQWNKNDWELRAGRQRINWGTNLVWNPNDLFNAFSFFDFDYEERPGADAIRLQKYTGFASSVELAVKIADDMEDFVAAGMWKVNSGGYDVQFIGGVANENVALGLGWAGNIRTSGFKGEATYFQPFEVSLSDKRALLASLTWDYSFTNSLYIMWSGLYNSAGSNEPGQFQSMSFTSTRRLTTKNLTNYKFSTIVQATYPIHPLLNAGLAVMLFPGDQAMFIFPTLSWSIVQNLDLDIFAQLFWDDPSGEIESTTRLFFTRLKWSF